MRLLRTTPARAPRVGLLVLAAGAAAVGCRTWDDFQGLADTTSVWKPSIGTPGPRFGTILVGYETPYGPDEARGTRLYVGGTGMTDEAVQPFATYAVWQERVVSPGTVQTVVLPDTGRSVTASAELGAIPAVSGCGPDDREVGSSTLNCGTGTRAAAPFPVLDQMEDDLHGCLAVTTGRYMGQERFVLRCEDQRIVIALPVENGLGLGQSAGVAAAGVPIYHPFGVAVFGAPEADGRGALIRVQHMVDQRVGPDAALGRVEGGVRVGQLELTGLTLADGARLGRTVALTLDPIGPADEVPSPGLRIAATFGAERPTVVVADLVSSDRMRATFQVVGCLAGDADDVGFGSALAFGDFDGDGIADLAVGSQPLPETPRDVVTPLDRPVVVFDGRSFDGPTTCDERAASSARPAVTIGCTTEENGMRFDCAQSRFGHALAAGDLDGDGLADLIVGAPGVGAAFERSGVVELVRGTTMLASMGSTDAGRHTLWLAESNEDAGLGWAVTAVPAPNVAGPDAGRRASRVRRAELAVSQISPTEVRLFYCSGLDGDSPPTMQATGGAALVRGCGLRPGNGPSQLDPRQRP